MQNKKLSVPASTVVVTCATGKHKLLIKKALVEANVSLELEVATKNQQTITIFKSIIIELLGVQLLSEALNGSGIFLERLLSLEELDFIIARDSSVIEMRKHNE